MRHPSEEAARLTRPGAAVRSLFVERDDPLSRTPLESLLSGRTAAGGGGGAGGKLRIALLLSILWVQAHPPYTSTRVAPWWARLLQLADPEGTGARQVRDTLHELRDRGFVSLTPTHTGVNEIRLLNELGTGDRYTFPSPADGERYFRIPRQLWADGWMRAMTGRALAVYLATLSNAGWKQEPFWISSDLFHSRYGMGDTTRKKGFRELVDLGVLDIDSYSTTRQEGTRTFRRNVYTFNPDLDSPTLDTAATDSGTPPSADPDESRTMPPQSQNT